jgi:hypothetical protein
MRWWLYLAQPKEQKNGFQSVRKSSIRHNSEACGISSTYPAGLARFGAYKHFFLFHLGGKDSQKDR